MIEVSVKSRLFIRLAIVACAGCMVGGCGWTARDEFYRNRSLVLAPEAGDRSQITSTHTAPGAPFVAMPQMAQSEEEPRGRSMQ